STPDTDTLSLHDALPIDRLGNARRGYLQRGSAAGRGRFADDSDLLLRYQATWYALPEPPSAFPVGHRAAMERCRTGPVDRFVRRSEEHTSELQSREKLVC